MEKGIGDVGFRDRCEAGCDGGGVELLAAGEGCPAGGAPYQGSVVAR